ncbi:MAG TPA: hypothetical protein VLR26_03165 [Frankiaceae bacterium]|nr:hypothetical protein [Frankiaceae bacterium]
MRRAETVEHQGEQPLVLGQGGAASHAHAADELHQIPLVDVVVQ